MASMSYYFYAGFLPTSAYLYIYKLKAVCDYTHTLYVNNMNMPCRYINLYKF